VELIHQDKVEDALVELDSMNWRKIHNINGLLKGAEIYEEQGQLGSARELLEIAHERSPIGRTIIYRLALLSIRLGECDEAKEYYDEFVEIAPHDNLKYVIRYELNKAKGVDPQTLIGILEELKAHEFEEKWAYELAVLYHKTGQVDKCISLCDEIILWFGEGPYVENALELKMIYHPLDKTQEDKYRRFRQQRDGITEIRPEDPIDSSQILHHPVEIPRVELPPERFDTVNLQAEIKKNIEEIMQATETGEVTENMEAIRGLVGDLPFLQVQEEEDPVQTMKEEGAKIDESLKNKFQEYLIEEHDGQMSMFVPDTPEQEPPMEGQLTISDIMANWEKTRRAAEQALEEADKEKLEQTKAKAIQEANQIMDRLEDVAPRLDAGTSPRELMQEDILSRQGEEGNAQSEPVGVQGEMVSEDAATGGISGSAAGAVAGAVVGAAVSGAGTAVDAEDAVAETAGFAAGVVTSGVAGAGDKVLGHVESRGEDHTVEEKDVRPFVPPVLSRQETQALPHVEDVEKTQVLPHIESAQEAVDKTIAEEEQAELESAEQAAVNTKTGAMEQAVSAQAEEIAAEIMAEEEADPAEELRKEAAAEKRREEVRDARRVVANMNMILQREIDKYSKEAEEAASAEDPDVTLYEEALADQLPQMMTEVEVGDYLEEASEEEPATEDPEVDEEFSELTEDEPESVEAAEAEGEPDGENFGDEDAQENLDMVDKEETPEGAAEVYDDDDMEESDQDTMEDIREDSEDNGTEDTEETFNEGDVKDAAEDSDEEDMEESDEEDMEETDDEDSEDDDLDESQILANAVSDIMRENQEKKEPREARPDRDPDSDVDLSGTIDLSKEFGDIEKYIEEEAKKSLQPTEDEIADSIQVDATEDADIQTELTEQEREMFTYFTPIAGMEQSLCQVLVGARERLSRTENSSTGNIIIQGGRGSGKTTLATNLIKVLQKEIGKPEGNVGKIDGENLNDKDIQKLFSRIQGGCLIIENAGNMNRETLVTLSLLMNSDPSGILVILEDSRVGIDRLNSLSGEFMSKFTEKVVIPILTIDELVNFGKTYALDMGYVIDDMGVLALYDRINMISTLEKPTYITEVKEIVDEAIDNAERKGFFPRFGGRKYDDEGNLILHEKHFLEH